MPTYLQVCGLPSFDILKLVIGFFPDVSTSLTLSVFQIENTDCKIVEIRLRL